MPAELLQRLSAGWSELLVYAAIGLVTLVGLMKCVYPVFRNASILNHSVVKLEKSMAQSGRAIWRDARFLGRSLRADWQRFLLNAGQLDLHGMPCDMDEYINEDTVVYKPGHAQLAELIPSLLTSLGILGTFLGLMEGLTSLDFSNAEGTIESIPSLLSGMRFAFATSVAGIACSLSFNVLNRIMVGRAFKALDAFDEAFYELAMPRPLEPDVQIICQEQDDKENLHRVAESVGSRVAGALEVALGRAMHPLTASMDHFIKGATQEQVEGIQTLVEQFLRQMNTAVGGQMAVLADTVNMVNQGQMQAQQHLKRTLEIAETLTGDAKRMQEATHRMVGDAMSSQAMEAASASLYEELESLTLSLARMKCAINELTGRMEESLQGAQRVSVEEVPWEENLAEAWPAAPVRVKIRGARKSKQASAVDSQHAPGLEA